MEENLMKALTIGFAVFVFIITIVGIMQYYNTAVMQAQSLNERSELTREKQDIVLTENLLEVTIDGTKLSSLIRKYTSNADIQITLTTSGILAIENVNNIISWQDSIGNVSEAKLSIIEPNKMFKITKTINAAKQIILNAVEQ